MNRTAFPFLCLIALCAASPAALAAVSAADYRASLMEVYGRYQGVLALRDACNSAFPDLRAANDKAYAAWQKRDRQVHAELDQRFAMMVRAHSRDDKDYARNYGKYQGAILQQREEARQALLLNTRGDLGEQCRAMPGFLSGPESDLEKEFADEWAILRQWPLQSR